MDTRVSVSTPALEPGDVLKTLGATGSTLESLLEYCASPFAGSAGLEKPSLEEEPHVGAWEIYGAPRTGTLSNGFVFLARLFPQIEVPILKGVSTTAEYGQVARRGEPFDPSMFGGRHTPVDPEGIQVGIVPHPLGALPLVEVSSRTDFENLLRGMTLRSEPVEVNPSVYAQMISGIINWRRVLDYKEDWISSGGDPANWAAEMKRTAVDEPWRFRDRLILVCRGPYSGVSAEKIGLGGDPDEWVEVSRSLRIEHELTHYATKRLFGSMRNNLLDEIIADYMGCIAALGDYMANWQTAFWGLSAPAPGPEARVHAYRQNLDDRSFSVLCRLAPMAAAGLQALKPWLQKESGKLATLEKLTSMTLEDMAAAHMNRSNH